MRRPTGQPDVDERDLRTGRQRELHAPEAVASHLDPVAVERQDPVQSLSHVVVVLDEEDVPGLDRDSSTPVAPPGYSRHADGQAHDELAPPRPLALDDGRSAV